MRISRSVSSVRRQQVPAVYFTQVHSSRDAVEMVPEGVRPGVADRIKVFEELIRANSTERSSPGVGRPHRSRSCPARPWPPPKFSSFPEPGKGQSRLGSNLSLSGGSTSSGYTSTTPPSPEVEVRSRFMTLGANRSSLVDHDDDEEEKRIAREIFLPAQDHLDQLSSNAGLLFSSASTDEEDEGIRWSDLEAEMAPECYKV